MNITETKEYMYIPENYFGDGAPGYGVNKEIATHQEADTFKQFPYYQCVLMIGVIRVEKITESMSKDALFDMSKEAFMANTEQVQIFRNLMNELAIKYQLPEWDNP